MGGNMMSKLRTVCLIIILVCVFISLSRGFGALHAVADTISGDENAVFGDLSILFSEYTGLSYSSYLMIFEASAWASFAALSKSVIGEIKSFKKK